MMLYEFNEKLYDLKDEAVMEAFKKILKELENRVTDAETARYVIKELSFSLESLEQDDFFGTEGMRL